MPQYEVAPSGLGSDRPRLPDRRNLQRESSQESQAEVGNTGLRDHPLLTLQRLIGNRAVAQLVSSSQDRAVALRRQEDKDEDPLEPATNVLDLKDRAEAAHAITHEGGSMLPLASEGTEEIGTFDTVNGTILGPAELGLGIKDVVTGIHRGDAKGIKQAFSGGAGIVQGGASILTPVLGEAIAPVAPVAAVFGGGLALGNAGVEESPYDLPGAAADAGEWMHDHVPIPGAGAVGTLAGSIAETPAAAYYGTKRVSREFMHLQDKNNEVIVDGARGIADLFSRDAHADAPAIDLGSRESPDEPELQVAHEEAPEPRPAIRTEAPAASEEMLQYLAMQKARRARAQ